MEVETLAPVGAAESVAAPEVEVKDASAVTEEPKAGSEEKEAKKETPEWAQRKIDKLTAQKYQVRAEKQLLERELAELRAKLNPEQTSEPTLKPEDIDRLAEEKAAKRIAAQQFNEKCNSLVEHGRKEFKDDFEQAIKTLGMMGALFEGNEPTEFAQLVTECDAPHKVLHYLGTNPEEAERILALPSRSQARAIGLLEARLAQKPEPSVSKAPEPIKPVGSRSSSSALPSDEDDMATWIKKEEARMRKQRTG